MERPHEWTDAHRQQPALAFRPLNEQPLRGLQSLTLNFPAKAPDITEQR